MYKYSTYNQQTLCCDSMQSRSCKKENVSLNSDKHTYYESFNFKHFLLDKN